MVRRDVLDTLGFLLASNYRMKVLAEIARHQTTPKQISKATSIRINHVSNILREFMDKGLALCVTPSRKKGRIYELTRFGKEVYGRIQKDD